MLIKKGNIETFKKYQSPLLDIYFEAGTTEVMEQYLDRNEETEYMLNIFESGGYGYFVFDNKKLIGFMLAGPLSHDKLLPKAIKEKYSVEKCIYIEEMHLHKDYRGKGIGSKLMTKFIEEVDKKWDYLFIRAWSNNIRAINFYKKLGFNLNATINQKKIKKDRSGTFMIKKQYLFQKLNQLLQRNI